MREEVGTQEGRVFEIRCKGTNNIAISINVLCRLADF